MVRNLGSTIEPHDYRGRRHGYPYLEYTLGAVNTAFIDWIYCSKTPGAARASGSCPFLVYCHNNIFTTRTGYGMVRLMWKPADVLSMTAEQKRTLEAWIRARTTPQKIVLRSRICVLAGEGKSNNAIADQLGYLASDRSALEETL